MLYCVVYIVMSPGTDVQRIASMHRPSKCGSEGGVTTKHYLVQPDPERHVSLLPPEQDLSQRCVRNKSKYRTAIYTERV